MTRVNQSGFSAVEAIMVIVVVALIGTAGWVVWRSQSNNKKTAEKANTTVAQSETKKTKTTIEGLGFDRNTLPAGWQVELQRPDLISLSIVSGRDPTIRDCIVEAAIVMDEKAASSNSGYAATLAEKSIAPSEFGKGYEYTFIEKTNTAVMINGKLDGLEANKYSVSHPDMPTEGSAYKITGYYVGDGAYAFVNLYCKNGDFTAAKQAAAGIDIMSKREE